MPQLRLPPVLRAPDFVNEVASRVVAAFVVVLTLLYLATGSEWVLAAIAYGFIARVLAGPTFSPVGQLAGRIIAPRIRQRPILVPGPPKRFAQGIGAVLSLSALLAPGAGGAGLALVLVAAITAAAFLESALGFCVGCAVFNRLITAGVLPESYCESCADITRRLDTTDRLAKVGS